MYDIYCRLRDDKKLKDSDVAKATGITKSTFSDWKNAKWLNYANCTIQPTPTSDCYSLMQK